MRNIPKLVSIIVPALNEENTIIKVVNSIIESCYKFNIDYEIILIDDGSSDKTSVIMKKISGSNINIKFIRHDKNMGIGKSFRDGVTISTGEAITWLPADGENRAEEILKYLPLLQYVDIVVPFVINTGIRNFVRRLISSLYLFAINFSFGTNFNYTNGTILYRKEIFKEVKVDSDGFFFNAECLIKAIRKGFIFAEVPIFLKHRESSISKAVSIKNLFVLVKDFCKLFINVHVLRIAGRVKRMY